MRSRKKGCPVSARDWVIEAKLKSTEGFTRVQGVSSISRSVSSDTDDGSVRAAGWTEPYVSKRNVSLSLEGQTVVDPATEEEDPGQTILNQAALLLGCDGDITLRLTDAYGHATQADYIVTGRELGADESEGSVSWSLEQVGAAENLEYIQVSGITLQESLPGGWTDVTEIVFDIADAARLFRVAFAPENASNQRYRLRARGGGVVAVTDIDADCFRLRPLRTGEADVIAVSVNGGFPSTLHVTVERMARPYETACVGTGIVGLMVVGRALSEAERNG